VVIRSGISLLRCKSAKDEVSSTMVTKHPALTTNSRAILWASATAATLIGLRFTIRASHSRFVPCFRAHRSRRLRELENEGAIEVR
jgi:hypothetical protein